MTQPEYNLLNDECNPYRIGSRTNGGALLAWFLGNVWRLDDEEVEAAICDGRGDKGMDAIVVDEDVREITIIQGKYRDDSAKTQGDVDLKSLFGAAAYFTSIETYDGLIASAPNVELLKLLARTEIRDRLEAGLHSIRLVFVTNADLDAAGTSYLAVAEAAGTPIEVWDRARCAEVAGRTRRPDLKEGTIVLKAKTTTIAVPLTSTESLVLALVPATELVALPGIADLTLFARNVRLSAGKTRINRELDKTVQDAGEHALFAAYHNGLTLLTDKFELKANNEIELSGVGVVNGCQSLLALYGNQAKLTDDLLVLVKVVEVQSNSDVADQITYRSNNQNAVSLRDQRSTEPLMRDLQGEVRDRFGSKFELAIRLGERTSADRVLDNARAAQLIMAVYLQEPWAAVRKLRLFDDDFRRIFSRNITADKLYLLDLMDGILVDGKPGLALELQASFSSIRYALNYLLSQVLRLSDLGNRLLDHPEEWLPDQGDDVSVKLKSIAEDVIQSVNFHVEDMRRDDATFDAKSAFKSQVGVSRLEHDAIAHARRQARRDQDYLFDTAAGAPSAPVPATSGLLTRKIPPCQEP